MVKSTRPGKISFFNGDVRIQPKYIFLYQRHKTSNKNYGVNASTLSFQPLN